MTNTTLPPKHDAEPDYGSPSDAWAKWAWHEWRMCRLTFPDKLAALTAENEALRAEVQAGDDFFDLIREARIEAAKAMYKFPQPNYVISKVAEEAGEVVKAAIHMAENRETAENLRGEMKQLIAMLYRLWVEGDQVHGLPPVRAALKGGQP